MKDWTTAEKKLLHRFPKDRQPLPAAYRTIYEKHLIGNRQGASGVTSVTARLESWMHEKVASSKTPPEARLLELGAGNLNHLKYEDNVSRYDVIEPFRDLLDTSPDLNKVKRCYADISEVTDGIMYDKVIAIAVLEHLCELPKLVAQCAEHLRPEGVFCVGIPSEGTPLWKLGWSLTTGIEFRLRHGLSYGRLMRHEHVNTAREIEAVLRILFGTVKVSVFGLSRLLSLYQCFECKEPDYERAKALLS